MTRKKETTEWRLGPLSPKKDGSHYVLPPQNFTRTEKWCGACVPPAAPGEITKIIQGNTRALSDRAVHPSRGMGC
jgi:hypothetical protein